MIILLRLHGGFCGGINPQFPKAEISQTWTHRELLSHDRLKQVMHLFRFVSTGHLSSQQLDASVR